MDRLGDHFWGNNKMNCRNKECYFNNEQKCSIEIIIILDNTGQCESWAKVCGICNDLYSEIKDCNCKKLNMG